jgi:hypothetical protein
MIDESTMRMLPLAKSVAMPGLGLDNLYRSLERLAPDLLRKDIGSDEFRNLLMRRLISENLFAIHNHEASVGIIIHVDDVADAGVYLMIGEPSRAPHRIHESFIHYPASEAPLITVFLDGVGARLVEILDIMFRKGQTDAERFENKLMTTPEDELRFLLRKMGISANDITIGLATLVLGIREAISRINNTMGDSKSPEEVLRKMLNEKIGYSISFQLARGQLMKAIPDLIGQPEDLVLYSHLAAGIHGAAWPSLLAVMHNGRRVEDTIPSLATEMRTNGMFAFQIDANTLKEHALDILDRACMKFAGTTHMELMDTALLGDAAQSKLLFQPHMALVRHILYNPSI